MSPNSVAFWTDYVKVVEDTLILSAAEMWAKECSFYDIDYCLLRYSRGYRERVRYGNRGQITERNYISYLPRKREPHFHMGIGEFGYGKSLLTLSIDYQLA